MPTYLPPNVEAQLRADKGHASLALARRRGMDIPALISNAEAVINALAEQTVALAEIPTVDLPDRPAEVAKVLGKVAADRAQREQAQQLATEWAPVAADRLAGAIQRTVSSWVPPLVEAFDVALDAFREADRHAPRIDAANLSALDPTSFGHWQRAQGAAAELDFLLTDRRALAESLREQFASHIFGDTLALATVVSPPTGQDSSALLAEARERRPVLEDLGKGRHQPMTTAQRGAVMPLQGIDLWRALLAAEDRGWLRLSLAPTGQAEQRLALVDVWGELPPHLFADASNQAGGLPQTTALLTRIRNVHATLTPALTR